MLETIADHTLTTPIHTLLKESLPSSMVLILTNYALPDSVEASKEKKNAATKSHKLLIKHLTEEVRAKFKQEGDRTVWIVTYKCVTLRLCIDILLMW